LTDQPDLVAQGIVDGLLCFYENSNSQLLSTPELGVTLTRAIDSMIMVYVPGGTFRMGSEDGDDDEKPVHDVTLDAFWIDRTEVTNAQYVTFLDEQGNQEEDGVTWLDLGAEDCLVKQDSGGFQSESGYADHPVVEVSWYGAVAYCEWAGARLPTEAEWEYAARGEQGLVYPWGDEFACTRGNFDDETLLDDYVVPGGEGCDGYEKTAPVGSFPSGTSWCEALDMAGNVWEWVGDWKGEYTSQTQTNPTGPQTGEFRVLRGGSWGVIPNFVRCAYRFGIAPEDTWGSLGFRCARGSR
jgi:formylglycine-generating enzyme required for sulfatase activity